MATPAWRIFWAASRHPRMSLAEASASASWRLTGGGLEAGAAVGIGAGWPEVCGAVAAELCGTGPFGASTAGAAAPVGTELPELVGGGDPAWVPAGGAAPGAGGCAGAVDGAAPGGGAGGVRRKVTTSVQIFAGPRRACGAGGAA